MRMSSMPAVLSTASREQDRGQVTIEFLGMTPLIILTLVLMWQFVLVGYTFTLAGNAADEAVRAGTAAAPGTGRPPANRPASTSWTARGRGTPR